MSFVLFLLLYAAVAIALVVVVGFILRDLRRKRLAKSPPPVASEGRAAKVKLPMLRKAPAPEPQPETPPPPRRRQLQTFADAEKATNADPAADLDDESAADEQAGAETEPDYAQAVLGRLEDVFERLQAGAITLDAYRAEVLAEQAAIEQRIAALSHDPEAADGEGSERAAALAARESARWCLDWADEQARPDG